jgi:hypothetical protein
MEIISKSEAQAIAKRIPDTVLEEVNMNISKGYALGSNSVSYSKPHSMEEVTWRALCEAIMMKGYNVKAESCQREGQWVRIEL